MAQKLSILFLLYFSIAAFRPAFAEIETAGDATQHFALAEDPAEYGKIIEELTKKWSESEKNNHSGKASFFSFPGALSSSCLFFRGPGLLQSDRALTRRLFLLFQSFLFYLPCTINTF